MFHRRGNQWPSMEFHTVLFIVVNNTRNLRTNGERNTNKRKILRNMPPMRKGYVLDEQEE